MINIKYIIKGGGFRGNLGSPDFKGGGFRGTVGSLTWFP